jgi:hypothetical protein
MLKKDRFGKYEIQYDTILDHDIFEYLRVTFEVPRDNQNIATVFLNGESIGSVEVYRENGKVKGYLGWRFTRGDSDLVQTAIPVNNGRPEKKLGKIAAMIVTNAVS